MLIVSWHAQQGEMCKHTLCTNIRRTFEVTYFRKGSLLRPSLKILNLDYYHQRLCFSDTEINGTTFLLILTAFTVWKTVLSVFLLSPFLYLFCFHFVAQDVWSERRWEVGPVRDGEVMCNLTCLCSLYECCDILPKTACWYSFQSE